MKVSLKLKDWIHFLGKIAVPVNTPKKTGLRYYQERIMRWFSMIMIYIGFLILIPSVYVSIINNLIGVAIIDVFVYLILFALGSFRFLTFSFRVGGILTIFYVLGVGLLLLLGPYGAGFIWLFAFPVVGGILLGLRTAIIASLINLITFILLGVVVFNKGLPNLYFGMFDMGGWIAVGANLLGLSSFIAVTLGALLKYLENSLKKEQKTKDKLKKEKKLILQLKEKAEQSDKLKTAFLSNVSHDIRTPMNAIMGFTDLIRLKNTSPEIREQYLQIVKKQGGLLMNLINDIIDVAKIESNELSFVYKRFNLNEYLQELHQFYKAYMKSERVGLIKLVLNTAWDDPESEVCMDDNRLRQVLNNLLINAIKFTERGQIEFGYYPENDNQIHFFVQDTGVGISKESQSIIFQRFRQVQPENSRVYGGTGIGLSICKSIVELQGGQIWVESEPDKGSTFHFVLAKDNCT